MSTATVVVNKDTSKFFGKFKHISGALKVAGKNKALIAASSATDLDMSATALVKLHNSVAAKPVKKFADLKAAQRRTFAALLDGKASAKVKSSAKTVKAKGVVSDDNRKIHTTKAAENKSWHEGSMRGQCFDEIKEGMTVKAYIDKVTKKYNKITASQARGCLFKMSEQPPKQKQQLVTIK